MLVSLSKEQFNKAKYKAEFIRSLGSNALFDKIQDFFDYLFLEETADRPLNERCYIIITRKGFSLWVAGMLCGMTGKRKLNAKRLISDRQWKLMTTDERTRFIKNKHVFIADDSVITGAMSQSVYLEIEVGENRAKSRSVAFLAADQSYSFDSMYQHYFRSDEVDVSRRREYTDKILHSMYQLSVPYTASSPALRMWITNAEFAKIKEEYLRKKSPSWSYMSTPLNFNNMDGLNNIGIFIAPINKEYGENVLLRGMRVCYTEFDIDGKISVTLIPWIIFDVIDFEKAKTYLRKCIIDYIPNYKKSWLYRQLEHGEPGRVETIVHRVISYLYDCCVLAEFVKLMSNIEITPYILPNDIRLEQYHFPSGLYKEMKIIEKSISQDQNYPVKMLAMDKATHDNLSENINKTSYSRLEIPNTKAKNNDIKDLRNKLLKQREVTKDENGNPVLPANTKKHPLICYRADRSLRTDYPTGRSLEVLSLIRQSIGSLRSEIISYNKNIYLINTLMPGEGSHLVFSEHYDFIYAFHQWSNMGNCLPGQEKSFAVKWNIAVEKWRDKASTKEKAEFGFKAISDKTVDAYFGTVGESTKAMQRPIFDWPSEYDILKSKGIDLDCFNGDEEKCRYFRKLEDMVAKM